MATPQRRAEAAQASSTFHVAMTMLGAHAFAEVLELWDDVVPMGTRAAATGANFVAAALRLVRFRRHQVQAILIPYLRLTRALHTGFTFQPVFEPEPQVVPLSKLRDDFVRAVERHAPEALNSGLIEDHYTEDEVDDSTEIQEPDGSTYVPYDRARWMDELDAEQEEIDRLSEILDEREAAAEAEAEAIMDTLARKLLEKKLAEIKNESDASREEVHGSVGRRVAAHAERMVQNGGRHAEEAVARADRRVIGFVRVHYPEKDPHPCSFCAMLISRGVVYKKKTATQRSTVDNSTWEMWRQGFDIDGAEFDKYHPLCHCRGEAVYSDEQFNDDARFQVNRDLDRLWQRNIAKKFSGKKAEAAWRALLKTLNTADQESAEEEAHERDRESDA